MLTFDEIVLGKLYRDKDTNFVGVAVMKSYCYNFLEPLVKLHGAVNFTRNPGTSSVPVYDCWISSLEEIEVEEE